MQKNIPDYINNLLISRRNELNDLLQFSDTEIAYFLKFNTRLKAEESRIDKFINSLLDIYQLNNLENIIDDFSYGGIVIQFLTSKEFTRSSRKEGVTKWSLYEIEIAVEDWATDKSSFYENTDSVYDNPFINFLPIEVRNEEICYLFAYLGNKGILALQDMINVSQVFISFPFLCRLKRV